MKNDFEENCPSCGAEMNTMQILTSKILICSNMSCRFSINSLSEDPIESLS